MTERKRLRQVGTIARALRGAALSLDKAVAVRGVNKQVVVLVNSSR